MKKALVTGGMGFIGNHLVHRLISDGVEVLVLDKSIRHHVYKNIDGAELIEGDVLSYELLKECLSKVDTCFHLAAISSIELTNRDWVFSHQNNVIAFNGLLENIKEAKKPIQLIYASSSAVYGDTHVIPLTEGEAIYPVSFYAADKFSNEMYAQALFHLAHIKSIGLRFFNVYGPGQDPGNPYSGVISKFTTSIRNGLPLTIYGDGQQTRDFIYIDDVVDALILSANSIPKSAEVFNVCTGKSISIKDLALLLIELTGHNAGIEHVQERRGDLRHSIGDIHLINKVLGFKAKISLKEGLKQYLESLKL